MSLPKNRDLFKTNSAAARRPDRGSALLTRCAVLTGSGRSAVAVVAIHGPQAREALLNCFVPATPRPLLSGDIRFGLWQSSDEDGDGESVVVTPRGCNSATGDSGLGDSGLGDSFEVHCHGGPAAIDRIIDDLQRMGVERVDPMLWTLDRWTPDCWTPDRGDSPAAAPLIIREAVDQLLACQTSRTAAVALDQVRGALRDWAERAKTQIGRHPDANIDVLHADVRQIRSASSFGLRLAQPFHVVLSGPPNVGKSSLVNAILGYDRSITLDVAGTTRDLLHADTVIDGIPIHLTDTAGIRESSEPIEREGVRRARTAAAQADLVIYVTQPSVDSSAVESSSVESSSVESSSVESSSVESSSDWPTVKSLRVMNKSDLASNCDPPSENEIRTVATTGDGVEELMQAIVAAVVKSFPQAGQPVPLNKRQHDCLGQILQTNIASQISDLLDRLLSG